MLVFKNTRDKLQIKYLARQMYPNNPTFLVWAYEDATKEPYSYLFLDLKPYSEESMRVRSKILNDGYQIVYIKKNL